jgi:hypothetical protein
MKNRSSYSETPGIRCQRLPGIPFDMIMSIHEMELPQSSSSLKPLKGWRRVNPRKHRKKVDWAHEVRELLEIDYPNARKIILICDNLNTHTIGAFYEAFPPEEASILVKRLEIHTTPIHGSWLNIAEIELSALSRQCLDRRLENLELLIHETKKWETSRNNNQKLVDWQFTSESARIKLKRLYPQF